MPLDIPDGERCFLDANILQLSVVPNESEMLPTVVAIAQTHRLLLGDASIVAQMQRHGVIHLATNDDDFERVPGITVWKPRP